MRAKFGVGQDQKPLPGGFSAASSACGPISIGSAVLALLLCAGTLAAQNPPAYVGADACQGCHEDITAAFQKNPHFDAAGKACETCHGPGGAHAESLDKKDIRNLLTLAAAAADLVCLSCHRNKPTQAGRIESGHARSQIACTSCHAVHKSPEELLTRKPAQVNDKCAGCHVSVWAGFAKPYTHRLREGAMSCVDCHNPHGRNLTAIVRTAAAANQPGCFQCHGEKRGPFVFEHAPMRTDGCSACHEPHGSANPRMLTRHEPRVVCLECHANVGLQGSAIGGTPPAFHDLRSPRFQNCAVCHIKVHGSHVSRALLR
jgi:DmsE family decaheme c-type cytochrome